MSLRTSTSVLVTTEGKHGPRGSSTVPSRRGTFNPPAAGRRQRPDAVPSLLRLRTVSAVPGRHWSTSLTTKRTLICQVKHWTWFCMSRLLEGAVGDINNIKSLQSQTEFVPWLLWRWERGADISPAHKEDPHTEEKDPQVRGEVWRGAEIQGRYSTTFLLITLKMTQKTFL